MSKGPDAFRTISEVADELDLPQHVLRFWETRFKQIKPLKRGGGRRYYRPDDVNLLRGIRQLLYGEGYTIRGVQRILKDQGAQAVIHNGNGENDNDQPERLSAPEPNLSYDSDDADYDSEYSHADSNKDDAIASDQLADMSHDLKNEKEKGSFLSRMTGNGAERGLSSKDVQTLQKTLMDLLECKRMLENAQR